MNFKVLSILIIVVVAIIGMYVFFTGNIINSTANESFTDMGISSDYNAGWNNSNLQVNRSESYTQLSNKNNHSQWYRADKTFGRDNVVIEWDNHGKPNSKDFCLISDVDSKKDTPINFINNLHIKKDCHVKLVVMNDTIIPYVDGKVKTPILLKDNSSDKLVFRFQINPTGADIMYSNFTIHY